MKLGCHVNNWRMKQVYVYTALCFIIIWFSINRWCVPLAWAVPYVVVSENVKCADVTYSCCFHLGLNFLVDVFGTLPVLHLFSEHVEFRPTWLYIVHVLLFIIRCRFPDSFQFEQEGSTSEDIDWWVLNVHVGFFFHTCISKHKQWKLFLFNNFTHIFPQVWWQEMGHTSILM